MSAFQQLSAKTENKETAIYTHPVEFQKHLHKNQLLLLSIAKFQTKAKKGYSHRSKPLVRSITLIFSQNRIRPKWKCTSLRQNFAIILLAGSEMKWMYRKKNTLSLYVKLEFGAGSKIIEPHLFIIPYNFPSYSLLKKFRSM